jgi:hypothetical protein
LRAAGQRIKLLEPGEGDAADIPVRLKRARRIRTTVFFIVNLASGEEPALRALNLRREYLVERALRVVFWLDEPGERELAARAPDFWAFRHRVVHLGESDQVREF